MGFKRLVVKILTKGKRGLKKAHFDSEFSSETEGDKRAREMYSETSWL